MNLIFYDLETTIPATDIIEFGAVILDKQCLSEKASFTTLIQSNKIDNRSINCNGITQEMVKDAPTFADVADRIFSIMDGQIWVGHNIKAFDNTHIIKAFNKIGQTPPTPHKCIDTLHLLKKAFGTRAGDMKLASLGNFFELGQEQHRAIDDCRMNIEILKNASMTLLLEKHA